MLKVFEKRKKNPVFNRCWCSILYTTLSNTLHWLFVPFITSLNTVRLLFGMIFNFVWLPDRQTVKKKIISPVSAHVRWGQIQSQSTAELQVCLLIHVPIRIQNITFNLNKLFLNYKLTLVDRGRADYKLIINWPIA